MMQLPSWAWTSLQIAAACIFLSLVVMVEKCDMAPLGRQSMFVQHVQRERGQACGRQHTRWPSILIEIQLQSVGALMAVAVFITKSDLGAASRAPSAVAYT